MADPREMMMEVLRERATGPQNAREFMAEVLKEREQPQEQGLSAKDYGIGQALNRIDALTLGGGARLYGNVGAAYSSLVDGKDFDTEFEAQRAEAQGYLRNYRDANPVMSTVESMAGGGLSGYNVGGAVAAGARALPGAAGRVLGGALTYSGRPGVAGNLVRGAQNVGAGAAFAAGEAINRGSDDVSTETALGAALGPAGAAAGRLAAGTIGKVSNALGDIFAPNGELSKEAADLIRAEGVDPKTIDPAAAKQLMDEYRRVGNDAARQEAVINEFAFKIQQGLGETLGGADQRGLRALGQQESQQQPGLVFDTARYGDGRAVEGGSIQMVDVRKLDEAIQRTNPQTRLSDERVNPERARRIQQAIDDGTAVPVPIVSVNENGRVAIPDGRHRVKAALNAGQEKIPVFVDEMDLPNVRQSGVLAAAGGSASPSSGVEALRRQGAISQDEYRFGVVLSDAQRRQDENALRRDEAIRNEVYGPQSAKVISQRDATQNAQVQAGLDRFGEEISGRERGILQNAEELGETVAFLREQTGKRASANYQAAEEAAKDVTISPGQFRSQVYTARRALNYEFSDQLAPQTQAILRDYERLLQPGSPGSPPTTWPNFASINAVRKRLTKMRSGTPANSAERAQLDTLRRVMDEETDKAFDNGLFNGDVAARDDLKKARAEWRAYKQDFFQRKGGEFRDGAGLIIQKMGAREAEPLEIANALFGASKVGTKGDGVKAIRRLKDMLAPEEFGLIQRAAWDKATKGFDAENVAVSRRGGLTPQKIAANIENFTSSDAKGSGLAKELFNEEQLQDMRRFAALLRKIPYENQYNPSRSGYTGARLGRQALEALVMGGFGAILGGPAGGVVSAAGAAALRQGINSYTDETTRRLVVNTWKDAQVDDTLRDARLDWAAIVGRNAAVFGGTGQEE